MEGIYRVRDVWYPGRIKKVRLDGTFDIAYDDGEEETRVPGDLIRSVRNGETAVVFEKGDSVDFNRTGKGDRWITGKVDKVRLDGTYDILYDGEVFGSVPAEFVRPQRRYYKPSD